MNLFFVFVFGGCFPVPSLFRKYSNVREKAFWKVLIKRLTFLPLINSQWCVITLLSVSRITLLLPLSLYVCHLTSVCTYTQHPCSSKEGTSYIHMYIHTYVLCTHTQYINIYKYWASSGNFCFEYVQYIKKWLDMIWLAFLPHFHPVDTLGVL